MNSLHGSDHYPILLSLSLTCQIPNKLPPLLKHKTDKADWNKYSHATNILCSNIPPPNPVNVLECYDGLVKCVQTAADNHIPRKNPDLKHRASPPWWDSECSDMIRKRKTAERSFTTSMSLQNYIALKKVSAEAKRLFKKKKKASWARFCESLSPRSPSSIVWQSLRRFRGYSNYPNPPRSFNPSL